jgi:hypothetical protein
MKHFYKFLIISVFLNFSLHSFSQVGIGTVSPNSSSMLDITSTTGGFLIPRMTQAQRTAIASPVNGLLLYQTDATAGFWYYNGSAWATFASSGWSTTGDAATNPATDFIGTTDAQDFVIATNNTERVRIQTTGNIGINQPNPSAKLHITGTAPTIRIEDGAQGLNKVLSCDANGAASWSPSSIIPAGDQDWIFASGNTFADPVYHTGPVVVGRTGTTTHHLDIDNGSATGTTLGIGDVERIVDGNNETQLSHQLVPDADYANTLGTTTNRWTTVYATNGTIQTSDGTKKTAIQSLPYGLSELMKLRPVSYYWKEERHNSTIIPQEEKQLKLGLIAQEVQQIIPEVVYTYGWKPKSEKEKDTYIRFDFNRIGMNYEELIPLLVKAKQEQNVELEKITAKTKDLSNRLQQLLTSN